MLNKNLPAVNQALLGVVLNGGKSSRMGRDKSTLVTPGGRLFLDLAMNRFNGVCRKHVLSIGSSGTTFRSNGAAFTVRDTHEARGPLGGILSCINYASSHGFAACFFTPIDMPFVAREHLLHLREKWLGSPHRIVCAFNPTRNSIEPLFSIIPASFRRTIEERIQSSRLSVEGWIKDQHPLCVSMDANALKNINNPTDYTRLLAASE